MPFDPTETWPGFVPPPTFEEYAAKHGSFVRMHRENGIIEVRLHTDDGPYQHSAAAHNAWPRVWQDVGNDPENQVLIITGTGEKWLQGKPTKLYPRPASELDPDHLYQRTVDAWKVVEGFVTNIDIPTIAVVNGPGFHTEFALMSDITLAAPDANFLEPHFWLGTAPGDGHGMALEHLMGAKRAAYHMYAAKPIPADKALEWGLVSDVLPREELQDRAWDLARFMMKRPRYARWAIHNIVTRRWRKAVAEDFGAQYPVQMLATIASQARVPDPELLADTESNKDF